MQHIPVLNSNKYRLEFMRGDGNMAKLLPAKCGSFETK